MGTIVYFAQHWGLKLCLKHYNMNSHHYNVDMDTAYTTECMIL